MVLELLGFMQRIIVSFDYINIDKYTLKYSCLILLNFKNMFNLFSLQI